MPSNERQDADDAQRQLAENVEVMKEGVRADGRARHIDVEAVSEAIVEADYRERLYRTRVFRTLAVFGILATLVAASLGVALGVALARINDLKSTSGCRAALVEDFDIAQGDFLIADAEVKSAINGGILASITHDQPTIDQVVAELPDLVATRGERLSTFEEVSAHRQAQDC